MSKERTLANIAKTAYWDTESENKDIFDRVAKAVEKEVLERLKNEEEPLDALTNDVICSACGSVNSIRWEKKGISIDDKQGSYKYLTFDFCEECGNVTDVGLS